MSGRNDDRMGFERSRARMVQRQLVRRGIRDEGVLAAMGEVPREEFLPVETRESAYRDAALPLQDGQTISQPYIVALMAEAMELKSDDRVLEVGTGSGYAAAVLSRIAGFVDTIERIQELSATARGRLERLGFSNVAVHTGDGSLGWSPGGPYDAVCVSAAAPAVPQALVEQLTPSGRLVVPVGAPGELQVLTRVRPGLDGWVREPLADVRFVPLMGEQGWGEGP